MHSNSFTKKQKIALICVAILLGVAIIIGSTIAIVISVRDMHPTSLSREQREILLKRNAKIDYTPLDVPLAREISPNKPLNFITYYGDAAGVTELWNEIPADIQSISVLLLIKGNILAPGNSPQSLIEVADECDAQGIPYALQIINGETHYEWIVPLAWIEEEFCNRPYCYGISTAELYNGEEWRGQLDGDMAWYINDSIRLMAKYGKFLFITDTNKFGTYGTFSDWIEENEYLYTTMQECAEHIIMQNKESYGDPSSYSLMKGLYLAGLIGGWGVSTDWWHWQVSNYKVLFGEGRNNIDNEWERIYYYPEIMQTMSLAMVAANGAFCFKNEAEFYSVAVDGKRTATFQWCTIPFFRSLTDGTIRIPSREEMLMTENVAVVGAKHYDAIHYDLKESTLYPNTPDHAILCLLPENIREKEISVFNQYGITLVRDDITAESLRPYAHRYGTGNTYLSKVGDQWLYLNNCENQNVTKSATATDLQHNGTEVRIESGPHGYVFFREYADKLTFSLNNYRVDKYDMISALNGSEDPHDALSEWVGVDKATNSIKATDTTLRTTVITVQTPVQPQIVWHDSCIDNDHAKSFSYDVSYQDQVFTLQIHHNGYIGFDLILPTCDMSAPVSRAAVANDILSYNETSDYTHIQNLLETYEPMLANADRYSETAFAAFRKAYSLLQIAVTSHTVSADAVDRAIEQLTDTPMLETGTYFDLLHSAFSLDLNDEQNQNFDRLLREILSPTAYYNYKDRSLTTYWWTHRKNYTTSVFKMKSKALEKQYRILAESLPDLTQG